MLKGHFDQKGHKFVIGTIESSNRQCILCGQEGTHCQSEVIFFCERSKDILWNQIVGNTIKYRL